MQELHSPICKQMNGFQFLTENSSLEEAMEWIWQVVDVSGSKAFASGLTAEVQESTFPQGWRRCLW